MVFGDGGLLIYTKAAGALSNLTFANRCTRRQSSGAAAREEGNLTALGKANGGYLKPGINEPALPIFLVFLFGSLSHVDLFAFCS